MKYSIVYTADQFDPDYFLQENVRDLVLKDFLKYPNNSIVHKPVYEKLLDNIDKIPISDLEEFINKYS